MVFGLGCQNVVADILAGLFMTFEGAARVGDTIVFNDRTLFILSVGMRTTLLTWFGEAMVVRNNDLKNYYVRPAGLTNRVTQTLRVDMREPLERVEQILSEELPRIHDVLNQVSTQPVKGPKYSNIIRFGDGYYEMYFACYCEASNCRIVGRALNRELGMMCQRRGIRLALPQVVVNQPADGSAPPDLTEPPDMP